MAVFRPSTPKQPRIWRISALSLRHFHDYHQSLNGRNRPMRERSIASHFARAALEGARRQGHDCAPLLQRLSIAPQWLDEPRARLAPEQFTQLLQGLWPNPRYSSSRAAADAAPLP